MRHVKVGDACVSHVLLVAFSITRLQAWGRRDWEVPIQNIGYLQGSQMEGTCLVLVFYDKRERANEVMNG